MDERRVADYFVVAGLPENPDPLNDFSRDGTYLKPTHNQAPITDISVFFPGYGEIPPDGYVAIEHTPTGFPADLNHGSLRSPEVYLCIRRGWDKPPLVDIGVMFEGKERVMADAEIVLMTPGNRYANVNNSAAKTYVTYRRAPVTMPCNELVVTDVCVVLTSKGEVAPHAFCMITKNLNKGLVGSNVFLCYKKSMNRANLISYRPGILSRYPHYDQHYFPFPTSVPMFCLPMGASLESWPKSAKQPRPVFSTFVLTVADASEKVYGSAVTFYEQIPMTSLTPDQCAELNLDINSNEETINVNKSICLLSHWPFFDTFEKFLTFVLDLSNSHPPQIVPIERHISHFLECVPFPSPQRPHILVQLSANDRIMLTQPEDLPLPRSGASFRELLINLRSENCLMVLLLALTEQKLLVHSLRPAVLTAVAEAISMIMFPLKWQCPYIPLCPLGLAEVLHAPLPFLIGVDSRFFDMYDPPPDVTCIDLDTNHITVCEEKRSLSSKLLPKKPARQLRNTLDLLHNKAGVLAYNTRATQDSSIDREFQLKRKEQALELEIQEAFLRFMASTLKGYRVYLLPITKAPTAGTTDPNSLFDFTSFMRSRDKTHHKFYVLLTRTQMFIRFIEERSFVSDMDAGLAFFDECTEKVDCDEGDGHLLELDESHRSERTVFILPPEPSGLPPGETYEYQGFTLNAALFVRKDSRLLSPTSARLSSSVPQPGSPMARRTKHEIKSAQKLARKNAGSPESWAKCLLGACYSLWFIHLPSYALQAGMERAPAVLRDAYDVLVRIHHLKLRHTDEVCYRVMMQLCGVYSQPVLAVKLLFHMKRCNVQPNAITYGFYNRAVLDSQWPSDCTNSSQLMWNKLRNVIVGVALFRRAGSRKKEEEQSPAGDGVSRTSLESATSQESCHAVGTAVDLLASSTNENTSTLETCPANESSALDLLTNDNALEEQNDDSSSGSEGKLPSRIVTSATDAMDFATFDRFRSRVGSIVRPSGLPLLSPNTLQQQSFESSAGLLMTGTSYRPTSRCDDCDEDVFEGEALFTEPRQRYRTGSLAAEFPVFTRHAKCPTSPKEEVTHCPPDLGMLIRSESFANDAQILGNLQRLKLTLNNETPSGRGGKRHAKPSLSRSLFGRPGLTNNIGLGSTASFESSTEHLSERSSVGSTDDLDAKVEPTRDTLASPDESGRSRTPLGLKNSPVRTPVTENDPLGALDVDVVSNHTSRSASRDSSLAPSLDDTKIAEAAGGPVLFGGVKGVSRSQTFSQDPAGDLLAEGKRDRPKPMHRSSTMPVDATPPSAPASSMGGLGSGFKLPFSRYSPGRFSLRKEDLRKGTQIIENAFNNFSPSSLTSKKSNEIFLGGLSSLKSAATSVVKRFDEIKEAMSTPVKTTPRHRGSDATRADDEDAADNVGSGEPGAPSTLGGNQLGPLLADSWPVNLWEYFNDGSRKGSANNLQPIGVTHVSQLVLPENLYPRDSRTSLAAVALDISMTTCSKCHHCSCVLYDEEIMAGWVPEDSNLNTKCQFCNKATVPFLMVTVTDLRAQPMNGVANEEAEKNKFSEPLDVRPKSDDTDITSLEPITVPYLNPLVLRKEFENILHCEGDTCLVQSKFVDEHPIIYWNMVWVFQRINVVSHLPGLSLGAVTVNRDRIVDPSWETSDHTNVSVRCMWDNPRLHEEVGLPMYVLWQQNAKQSTLVSALVTERNNVSRAVMQMVIRSVRCSDLHEPLKKLATERQKMKGRGVNRMHSIYRDILYLSMTVMGRENIDQGAFDREYVLAYERLPERDLKLFHRCDRPLSLASLCCRHFFRELQL